MPNSIKVMKESFAGGEFDPQMQSKIGLQKYWTGCKTMRNFFSHINGSASNRSGLLYVTSTKYSTTVQSTVQSVNILPFKFSNTQAYILEFGNQYLRFIKDGAPITYLGNPYEISTTYAQSAVMDLGFTQSADTVFLAHPIYRPQILQRITDTNWTIKNYPFVGGPFMLDNTDVTQLISSSALSGTVTLTASGFSPFVSGHVGALWELFHDIPNQIVTTAFTGTAVSSTITCGGTWRVISHGTWTGHFTVQKSLDGGSTWTDLKAFSAAGDFNANTFGTEDMSGGQEPFLVRISAVISSGTLNVDLTTDPFIQNGIVRINSYTSGTVVHGTVERSIGKTSQTSDWAEGAWSDYRGWPSTVEFTPDDRLLWADNSANPANSWLTRTSNYYDFSVSDPLVDSDALNITLPSRDFNGINGIIPLRNVIVLTAGSEWSIESTNSGALTPATVFQKVHGHNGNFGVRPVLIGNRAIYIQNLGKVIRDIGYELISDSFVGSNISVFSNQLFYFNTIVDMAYQQNPDSIVWMVRDDGMAISLTYLREQDVVSFARHDTDGKFTSVASIPNQIEFFDEVYFVVNRDNGQFIERLTRRIVQTICSTGEVSTRSENQVFVDSAVIYGDQLIKITAISNTNPVVVTASAHGLSNGDLIRIEGVSGMTELNGNTYIIEGVTTDTFELFLP